MGTECRTIAFHGGFLSPESLRRDMGDPAWVDEYRPVRAASEMVASLASLPAVALVGFSNGGSLIGHLSHVLPNIRAAVLYESALIGIDRPDGSFPVLWIRNRYRSTPHREAEFNATRNAWKANHDFYEISGKGRHVSWRFAWPPFGHCWDQSLNPFIEQWLRDHCPVSP